MTGDFGRCSDSTCQITAGRLFRCAHHCTKMVCLEHLIEHDRLIEHNREEYENVQEELKRFYSIYFSLVDEEKIRCEYEEKLTEHRTMLLDVNHFLENHYNDIEQVRTMVERLKKAIEHRQKSSSDALTIVKVEPAEEEMNTSNTTSLPSESIKDELVSISYDRVENLVIDTDYHRRQTADESLDSPPPRIKTESSRTLFKFDGSRKYSYIRNISGHCPLWVDGSFGLTEQSHGIRLCYKKRFSDLNDHLRRYHGLLSPIAYFLTRASEMRLPWTRDLFPSDLQVADPHRSFLCPMRDQCHMRSWIPSGCLKRHLIDVHHMTTLTAQITTNNVKISNRSQSTAKIRNRAFDVVRQMELDTPDQSQKSRQRNQTH